MAFTQMAANEACYHVVFGYILFENFDKAFDPKDFKNFMCLVTHGIVTYLISHSTVVLGDKK